METVTSFTIDDAGSGGADMVDSMRRTCQFMESRGIRATWFVVPKSGGKPMSEEWKAAVIEARDAGHDIQLHGLTHSDCYEFGPPNWPATSISPTMQPDYDARREALLPRYTVANLRSWIEEGMEIFERDLGVQPTLFRAPCGAISKAMFKALSQVDITYHSCQYISGTGYGHLSKGAEGVRHEWADVALPRPYRWYSGVIEVPILNEYTWRGASQHEEAMRKVAQADLTRIAQESPVCTVLMHTHGIASDYDYTFRMIDYILENPDGDGPRTIKTMRELAEQGVYAAAATEQGADTLTI